MAKEGPESNVRMLVFGLTRPEEDWLKASQVAVSLPIRVHPSLAHFFHRESLPTDSFRKRVDLVVLGRHYELGEGSYTPQSRVPLEPLDVKGQMNLAHLWFPNANLVYAVNARVPFQQELLSGSLDHDHLLGAFAFSTFRDADFVEQVSALRRMAGANLGNR